MSGHGVDDCELCHQPKGPVPGPRCAGCVDAEERFRTKYGCEPDSRLDLTWFAKHGRRIGDFKPKPAAPARPPVVDPREGEDPPTPPAALAAAAYAHTRRRALERLGLELTHETWDLWNELAFRTQRRGPFNEDRSRQVVRITWGGRELEVGWHVDERLVLTVLPPPATAGTAIGELVDEEVREALAAIAAAPADGADTEDAARGEGRAVDPAETPGTVRGSPLPASPAAGPKPARPAVHPLLAEAAARRAGGVTPTAFRTEEALREGNVAAFCAAAVDEPMPPVTICATHGTTAATSTGDCALCGAEAPPESMKEYEAAGEALTDFVDPPAPRPAPQLTPARPIANARTHAGPRPVPRPDEHKQEARTMTTQPGAAAAPIKKAPPPPAPRPASATPPAAGPAAADSPVVFRAASRKRGKVRFSLNGASGAGKTYSLLAMAAGMAEVLAENSVAPAYVDPARGPIFTAVIDTENGSAEDYAGRFAFDALSLEAPYRTDRYLALIRAAAAPGKVELGDGTVIDRAGYPIVIVDSLSHAWDGKGGLLDLKAALDAANPKDGFRNWDQVKPHWVRFREGLMGAPCHLLVGMRAKQDYQVAKDANGRNTVEKLGLAPVMRDGLEFEFTSAFTITAQHYLEMGTGKDRTGVFASDEPLRPDVALGRRLMTWRLSGAEEAPTVGADPLAGAAAIATEAPAEEAGASEVQRSELSALLEEVGIDAVTAKAQAGVPAGRLTAAGADKLLAHLRGLKEPKPSAGGLDG